MAAPETYYFDKALIEAIQSLSLRTCRETLLLRRFPFRVRDTRY